MPVSANHNKFVHNSYVNPISLDFFVDVVSRKQQMYDEGRSLVQKQLDTFDKLKSELVNDADKAYLEQEITKMTESINQNAGLDFSNKANLQAVLNIGKPLENDKILMEALRSSKNYNQMMSEYQKLDANAKSPANDRLFFKEMQKWREANIPGAKLSYQAYKPYQKGVVDKHAEAIKVLKPTMETKQVLTKDGWIETTKISGVDAQRFADGYMAMLTPAEKEQLQIDAEYNLETVGVEKVRERYQEDLNKTFQGVQDAVKEEEARYTEAKNKFGETHPDVQTLKKHLQELKIKRDVVQKKASRLPEQISSSELSQYLMSEDLMSAASSFAYKEVERKIDENPYYMANYKDNLERKTYEYKKAVDLQYQEALESRGLGGGSEGENKGFAGFVPMSAKDTKAMIPIQNFEDLSRTSVQENNALKEGLSVLTGYKLAEDGQTLVDTRQVDKSGRVVGSGAKVSDLLELANKENQIQNSRELNNLFLSATNGDYKQATYIKELFLRKLQTISNRIAEGKNSGMIAYTARNKSGKEFVRKVPVETFLNESASTVLPAINNISFYDETITD